MTTASSTSPRTRSDVDLKQSLQDTGYVVLGLGVIGYQQAQKGARWALDHAGDAVSEVRERADEHWKSAKARLESRTQDARRRSASLRGELRTRVESIGDEVRGRADDVSSQAKARFEPVVDQLQQLPEQAAKAVETGRDRVQKLVPGRESVPPSAAASRAAASTN